MRWQTLGKIIGIWMLLSGILSVVATGFHVTRAQSGIYYLAEWEWQSEDLIGGEGTWAILISPVLAVLDLRPLPVQATPGQLAGERACCALVLSDHLTIAPGLTVLGTADSADSQIDGQTIATITQSLGLKQPITSTTLRGLVYELAVPLADPTGEFASKPVLASSDRVVRFTFGPLEYERPAPDGSIEWAQTVAVQREFYDKVRTDSLANGDTVTYKKVIAHLAEKYDVDYRTFLGDNPDEGTVAPTSAYSEDWNCSDNASLTCDQTWTELDDSAWTILSNKARLQDNSGAERAFPTTAPLSTDDQYGYVTLNAHTYVSGNQNFAIICRKDSTSANENYAMRGVLNASANLWQFIKRIAGTETILGQYDVDPIDGDQAGIIIDGSNWYGLVNGIIVLSGVDTGITGNLFCGIRGQSSSVGSTQDLDDWQAQDYQTPTPTPTNTPTPTATPTNTPTPIPTAPACSSTLPVYCIDEPVSVELEVTGLWAIILFVGSLAMCAFGEWRKTNLFAWMIALVLALASAILIPSEVNNMIYFVPTIIVFWVVARFWLERQKQRG